MVAYQEFVALSRSSDSEDRGRAAYLAAVAYASHAGPADEHAALYAALIGFLDDPSVKVRAALAYGLLHAKDAPRPILLSLLHDSPIISRAVAQYSPALIDTDLIGLAQSADGAMLLALTLRTRISARLCQALVERGKRPIILRLLRRKEIAFRADMLCQLAEERGTTDAQLRGALLARPDLPARARLSLVDAAVAALSGARIVKGAIASGRLERLLRNAADTALTTIGEQEAAEGREDYAAAVVDKGRINPRVMLHAIANGHVLFLADCLAEIAEAPRDKVFTLLGSGSRAALNALLARCGLGPAVRNTICRLILLARTADLADDVAARHYVVTALTEELIAEHEGDIPPELEACFAYLSEQNVTLARRAARGVMSAFAAEVHGARSMPVLLEGEERLALPAA